MKRWLVISFAIALIAGSFMAGWLCIRIFKPNVTTGNSESLFIHIPTGSVFRDVTDLLARESLLINRTSFEWLAKIKNYPNHVKPGKYAIRNNMNNNDLINLLRSGSQTPVKVVISNAIHSKEQLAAKVATFIEADSTQLMATLNDESMFSELGFSGPEILAIFISNTYEFYWNTSAENFVKRMLREFKKVWTKERKEKAVTMDFSPAQVSVLASIIQTEQSVHKDELPKLAGVFINRLKKGMKLQSDPTLVYGTGEFSINRVLNYHKDSDTPYNTYLYPGLPPGPVSLPEISAIDAVLNHEKHDYLFFCAREDFSHYHNFSKTYEEHMVFAKRYRDELNRRNILQ